MQTFLFINAFVNILKYIYEVGKCVHLMEMIYDKFIEK